jgi:hypothetical protein
MVWEACFPSIEAIEISFLFLKIFIVTNGYKNDFPRDTPGEGIAASGVLTFRFFMV